MISNLSRHSLLCARFLADESFLETLGAVLDHTLRDLVFYSVGIIINMSLHGEGTVVAAKILKHEHQFLSKMIGVLRDANLEDLDLARVAAKAIHNLQKVPDAGKYWTEEQAE